MLILFIDPTNTAPYDGKKMRTQGMGGSESTLVRIAEAFASDLNASITVAQHNRTSVEKHFGVEYIPLTQLSKCSEPNIVIHQRDILHISETAKKWPNAKQYFWLHNSFPSLFLKQGSCLLEHNVATITVSFYHAQTLQQACWQAGQSQLALSIRTIYNPVDEHIAPIAHTEYDPYLISYTSSPNRGLDQAIKVAEYLHQIDARYKLQIYNPGYIKSIEQEKPYLITQGSLPCVEMNQAIQRSLAVLIPNTQLPEAFGLVFAEANQAGVPVITHPIGAAAEVLADSEQLIDCNNLSTIVERIRLWSEKNSRPKVTGRANFSLGNIVQEWQKLFAANPEKLPLSLQISIQTPQGIFEQLQIPAEARIAVLTPTYNRAKFLDQTYQYFKSQQISHAQIKWFILDDSPQMHSTSWIRDDPDVCYVWQPQKQTIGKKRNLLNDMALAWGANFICAMDDDDWYGDQYIASMYHQMIETQSEIIGSSADYLYDISSGRIIFIPSVSKYSTCNNFMAYRHSMLKSQRYDENRGVAEEASFLHGKSVAQHLNPKMVHLALAHPSNTATKKNYINNQNLYTDLSLNDFPMTKSDRLFYQNLTIEYQKRI